MSFVDVGIDAIKGIIKPPKKKKKKKMRKY